MKPINSQKGYEGIRCLRRKTYPAEADLPYTFLEDGFGFPVWRRVFETVFVWSQPGSGWHILSRAAAEDRQRLTGIRPVYLKR